ncbi:MULTISPECIES: Ig-like domain-containing protein, partial [unclassified Campylobacter]|uniref:Ig-like domain-containing protein n=1 Tax=unclassified Campylobacter TaxID=2593542 RepID=UPI003D331FD6
ITEVIDDVAGGVVGKVDNNGLTNDNTPTIKGTATGSKVEIFDNGKSLGTTDVKDGEFEFTPKKPLADGEHEFTAKVVGSNGKHSEVSNNYEVKIDTDETANVNVTTKIHYNETFKNAGYVSGEVFRVNYGRDKSGKATLDQIEAQRAKYVGDTPNYSFKADKVWFSTDNKSGNKLAEWKTVSDNSKFKKAVETFLKDGTNQETDNGVESSIKPGINNQGSIDWEAYVYMKLNGYVYMEAGKYTLNSPGGAGEIRQYVNDKFSLQISDVKGKHVDGVSVDLMNNPNVASGDITMNIPTSGFYKLDIRFADTAYGYDSGNVQQQNGRYEHVVQQSMSSLRPMFKFVGAEGASSDLITLGNSAQIRFIDKELLEQHGFKLEDITIAKNSKEYDESQGQVVYNLETGKLKYADGYTTEVKVEVKDPTDGTPLANKEVSVTLDDGRKFTMMTNDQGIAEKSENTITGYEKVAKYGIKNHHSIDVNATDDAGNTIGLSAGSDIVVHVTNINDISSAIKGGKGHDTINLLNPEPSIDLSKVAEKFDDFEGINLKDGDKGTTLTLTAQDVLNVTNDADTVFKISGDSSDIVSGKGQWKESDEKSKAENGYKVYESTSEVNGQTIYIQIEDGVKTDF